MTGNSEPRVRTVLGDIPAEDLGHVQPHEHLLCDFTPIVRDWGVQPIAGAAKASTGMSELMPSGEFPAGVRARLDEPIRLDNYDWVRRTMFNRDNMRLDSEDDAIAELTLYRAAGGGTVVDSTPVGLGRDPQGYARIARSTGVHVVMGSGYYVHDYHPPGFDERPREDIRDEILRDLHEGVGDTGIRSGMIGEIGLSWPVHPDERKVLLAAVEAQRDSGAPLQIHPGRSPEAPIDAMRQIIAAGGDPERTIMSHIDRTLWELDDILEVARTGCFLELDLFGQESIYYAPNPDARRPNDGTRVEWLMALFDAGFGERLLIAQDICQKVYLRRYGGPGYAHILEQALPLMRRRGMSEEQIRMLTSGNPASILVFR